MIQMKAVQRFNLNEYRTVETGEIFWASMDEVAHMTNQALAVPVAIPQGAPETRKEQNER